MTIMMIKSVKESQNERGRPISLKSDELCFERIVTSIVGCCLATKVFISKELARGGAWVIIG